MIAAALCCALTRPSLPPSLFPLPSSASVAYGLCAPQEKRAAQAEEALRRAQADFAQSSQEGAQAAAQVEDLSQKLAREKLAHSGTRKLLKNREALLTKLMEGTEVAVQQTDDAIFALAGGEGGAAAAADVVEAAAAAVVAAGSAGGASDGAENNGPPAAGSKKGGKGAARR